MPRPLPRRTLRLEHLEDRATPATFTVNSLGDTGVGTDLSGDLRFCINSANNEVAFPGPDTITFAPEVRGGRVDLLLPDALTQGTGALIVTSNITIQGSGETIAR